jgi:hypothetical protein
MNTTLGRLEDIEPIAIAAYIEELGSGIAKPSVKQQLGGVASCLTTWSRAPSWPPPPPARCPPQVRGHTW